MIYIYCGDIYLPPVRGGFTGDTAVPALMSGVMWTPAARGDPLGHRGLAPAAADSSSIKNNPNTTNNTDKKSEMLFVKHTVSRAGAPRCELGAKQGRSGAEGPWLCGEGRRSASEPRLFLKPMREYYYLPNEQAQFLDIYLKKKKVTKRQKNLVKKSTKLPWSHVSD